MDRKIILSAALVATAALATSTPAFAGGSWTQHTHYCNCGHTQGGKMCGSTSSTSGGTTTSSGGTSGGGSSSSGGTAVPEPGMLGMMGLGLIGLGVARRRKARR
ncbi:PEP-CTERM sorting domain-containing protein [Novosphingobium album (ex Liu et al. 2023)]|uniref:PEP-CTERM sorting domain-containing protein n=1 Tax=Novosphingobium album (ex Liu et al. 2023) TaxID=3031130 RepID=A0ABT5WKV3_9SPHN|nr:PEP-CTERM sorting domain-containing protein [Novosphingobium album (ex Liu et al. 2023)]MDE8650672.1 PEP-CTERM sorting domain-containing protein [Novosphingobium album (ex Liu et al. 2023)]